MLKRNGDELSPDHLWFDELIRFFSKRIWGTYDPANWSAWCNRIRRLRNTIHAYRDNPLGSFAKWEEDIRNYREFLNELNLAVPYPGEYPLLDLRRWGERGN